ncbi:MAG: hypothetical protein OFPI_02590 [Osedax symbiont Rs2]|nr:MAG: hypothetical protein OFPI_02590 [Osedax symbiont Rs2]
MSCDEKNRQKISVKVHIFSNLALSAMLILSNLIAMLYALKTFFMRTKLKFR